MGRRKDEAEEAAEEGEAFGQAQIDNDFISVASTPKLRSVPDSSSSDQDDVDIITCSRVAATREVTSRLAMMPFGVDIGAEEEAEHPIIPQNGWGYDRPANRYHNDIDQGYVEVGGIFVPAPRSRAGPGRVRR